MEDLVVPSHSATLTFRNQCLPELESFGKFSSCGATLYWHVVLTVLQFSW